MVLRISIETEGLAYKVPVCPKIGFDRGFVGIGGPRMGRHLMRALAPQWHGLTFCRVRGLRWLGRSLSPGGAPNWCWTDGSRVRAEQNLLLANYPVSVGVAHVLVSRVASSYRRDAVSAGLGTGDAPIPVVVI